MGKATPDGRKFQPVWFWKLCLYVTVPVFTVVLFVQLWVQDLSKPYGGYPRGYQTFGWTILMALMLVTLGGRAPVWKAYADSTQAHPSAPPSQRPSGGGSMVELSAVVAQKPLGPDI